MHYSDSVKNVLFVVCKENLIYLVDITDNEEKILSVINSTI